MTLLDLGHLELVGVEVALCPLTREHASALAIAAGESRDTYGFNPVPDGLHEAETYIARALAQKADGQRYPFALSWRGRIVGTTSYSDFQPSVWQRGSALQRHNRPDAVEIGYTWLAASAQRSTCNTEAKLLLMRHAFEVWEVHSVCLRTDERNQRSRRAIERLGCRFEGIRRAHSPGADGTVRSSAFYSIIAAEWPAARERLLKSMLSSEVLLKTAPRRQRRRPPIATGPPSTNVFIGPKIHALNARGRKHCGNVEVGHVEVVADQPVAIRKRPVESVQCSIYRRSRMMASLAQAREQCIALDPRL